MRRERGLTLLELMIVVIIIAIIATLAIPRFLYSSTRTHQKEAEMVLKQIYVMQRAYFVEHEQYFIPGAGTVAHQANPFAFATLYVEIIGEAKYSYTIEANGLGFRARATCSTLDDDATQDIWSIDHRGHLFAEVDDATG
jgi:type IV pilus assembly protein PilE